MELTDANFTPEARQLFKEMQLEYPNSRIKKNKKALQIKKLSRYFERIWSLLKTKLDS